MVRASVFQTEGRGFETLLPLKRIILKIYFKIVIMTKQDIEDVKKEIKENEDRFYGEETISGSSPRPDSDDNVAEALEDVIGNPPKRGKAFSLAEEVEKDEEERRGE